MNRGWPGYPAQTEELRRQNYCIAKCTMQYPDELANIGPVTLTPVV